MAISCLPIKLFHLDKIREKDCGDDICQHSEKWRRLADAIILLFQKQRLKENELFALQNNVRQLLTTKKGTFLIDYFKNRIMSKGMEILFQELEEDSENVDIFLSKLQKIWMYFYSEILPILQAIFYPMKKQNKLDDIRKVTLIGFRDLILLKTNVKDYVKEKQCKISPFFRQMLLILQSVQDTYPPNDEIEALVAQTVIPFLGFRGLYEGSSIPIIDSIEPILLLRRRSSQEGRRLSRPLSIQGQNQAETLGELFRIALARSSSMSEV